MYLSDVPSTSVSQLSDLIKYLIDLNRLKNIIQIQKKVVKSRFSLENRLVEFEMKNT